jgi:hypothetical protein
MHAIVVFVGNAEIKKIRILKTGFRHCLTVLVSDEICVAYESLLNATTIFMIREGSEELRRWCHSRGLTAISGSVNAYTARRLRIRFFCCVESARRILREEGVAIITPWQLYRVLWNRQRLKRLDNEAKKD